MLSIPALLLVTSAPIAPQAVPARPSLAASSKWTVEYAKNSCNIGKTFGTSDKEVKLWMRLLPGRANTQLLIEENRDGVPIFRTGDLVITPVSGKPLIVKARNGSLKPGTHLILGALDGDALSALEDSDTLTLSYRREAFQLTGVNLKGALAAAQTCEDDLLRDWGVDPAELRLIATPAKALYDPADWQTGGDYPTKELNAGRAGSVVIKLDLAATGGVASCTVVVSSGVEAFDKRSCAMAVKRAKFAPARLADGKPVPSLVFLNIRWNIET